MRFAFFVSLFLIVGNLVPLCAAIGVSPPKYEIPFEPGKTKSFSHIIINNGNAPIKAYLNVSGSLAPYIELEAKDIAVGPESTSEVSYKLHMPERLPPGWNTGNILIVDNSRKSSGMFGISIAVEANIRVFVPFPELYAVGSVYLPNINEGEDVYYNVTIYNQGEKDIKDSDMYFTFYYLNLDPVKKIEFHKIAIPSMEPYSVADFLPAEQFSKGVYVAHLSYIYGNSKEPVEIDNTFNVGSYSVEITNHSSKLYAGQISDFAVNVRSNWNGPIPNVYSVIQIKGISYRSVETSLNPFGQGQLIAYVDDKTFFPGENITANATVFFGSQQTSKIVELTAVDPSLEKIQQPAIEEPKPIAVQVSQPQQQSVKGGLSKFLTSPTPYLVVCVLLLIGMNIFLLARKKNAASDPLKAKNPGQEEMKEKPMDDKKA